MLNLIFLSMKKLSKISLSSKMEKLDKLSGKQVRELNGGGVDVKPGIVSVTRFDKKDSGPGVTVGIPF